jgi:hypothetical protein
MVQHNAHARACSYDGGGPMGYVNYNGLPLVTIDSPLRFFQPPSLEHAIPSTSFNAETIPKALYLLLNVLF